MKLKHRFIIRSVAGQSVALSVGEEKERFYGMIKLNSVGEFIFKLLEKDTTSDEILSKITEKYDVSDSDAKEALDSYLGILRSNGLLEE